MSLAQYGTKPQRNRSSERRPSRSSRTTGRLSVGAPLYVGAKFGSGRSGGIAKRILSCVRSEERRTDHTCDTLLLPRQGGARVLALSDGQDLKFNQVRPLR